jgi:hypothetical protein
MVWGLGTTVPWCGKLIEEGLDLIKEGVDYPSFSNWLRVSK